MKAPKSGQAVRYALLAAGIAGILTGGYLNSLGNQAQAADDPAAAVQLPVVETVTVEAQPLRSWNTFSGRLTAVNSADIRPLVGGTIQDVRFEDSDYVEAGQTLFVIDPRPFETALQQAEAELASARSDAELAQVEFERAETLASRQTISQSQRDNRANELTMARARVAAAEARVNRARLDLDYAHVEAPFSGRIGRAEVTVGNVIEAGANAPVLARIVDTDTLYAEFDVDEATYFAVLQSSQGPHADNQFTIPVDVTVGNDEGQVHHADLHSFDNQLDIASGTIRARALVANHDGSLIPGVFASVRLGSASEEPTLLVPARAVVVNQDKRFVYVVNADDRVEYREVTLGGAVETQRVVLEGLDAGERVIVNGLQRVSTDMQVQTVAVDDAGENNGEVAAN